MSKSFQEYAERFGVGSPQSQPQAVKSYSQYLSEQAPAESSWQRTANRLKRVGTMMLSPVYASQLLAGNNINTADPSAVASKLGKDVINTLAYFDQVKRYGKALPKPGEEPVTLQQMMAGIVADPSEALGGAAEGMASLLSAPVEASTGLGLDRDTLYGLDANTRAERIKESVANIVGLAVGAGVEGAMAKGAITAGKEALAASKGVQATRQIARQVAEGAVKRTYLQGLAGGAAGGTAQTLVASAGQNNITDQLLLNNLIFAPLGVAFERLRMVGQTTDHIGNTIADEASMLAKARMLEVTTDDSFSGILRKLEGLEDSDSIAETLVSGKLRPASGDALVVPGVSAELIPKVVSKLAQGETKVVPQFFKRQDGLYDMAVGDMTNTQVRSFRDTGFLPDQLVEHNGRTYYFSSLSKDGKNVNLRPLVGTKGVIKPRNEIRIKSTLETQEIGPPPVKPGEVRFYHGGVLGDGKRWLSPDKAYAEGYAKKSGAGVSYVDLPADHPLVLDNAGDVSGTNMKPYYSSFEAPPEIAKNLKPLTTTTGIIAGRDIVPTNVGQHIWNDFKSFVMKDAAKGKEIPTITDFAESTPHKPFSELLDTFAAERGYSAKEAAVLERDFADKLFKETYSRMSPEEQAVISAMNDEVEQRFTSGGSRLAQAQASFEKASKDVISKAHSNGFYVDEGSAGNFVLRDVSSDKIAGRFNTVNDAIEFIDKSGQANGPDLIEDKLLRHLGTGLIHESAPPRAMDTPYIPNGPTTKIGKLLDEAGEAARQGATGILDWAAHNRKVMQAFDSQFGSQFFARVYDPVNVANLKYHAALLPWLEELQTVNNKVGNLSVARRELVSNFIETMSKEEVKARGGSGGRGLNNLEIAFGEDLAKKNVDIKHVMQYMRAVEGTKKDLSAGRIDQTQALIDIERHKQGFNIDDNHLAAAEIIGKIREQSTASLGAVTRYAEAIMNNSLSRDEFKTVHKLTPKELRLASDIEGLFNRLADTFNIPREHRLQNFMTHARLYDEWDFTRALRDFDMPTNVRDFYSTLARTNEISAYEKDPVRAVQRYLQAGFKNRILEPAIVAAKNAIVEELANVPPAMQGKAKIVAERYLDHTKNITPDASKATQGWLDNFLGKFGAKPSIKVREGIINALLLTGTTATQGGRLVAGARDFATGITNIWANYPSTLLKTLEYGVNGLDGIGKGELARGGLSPELGVIFMDTPTEFTQSGIGQGYSLVGRALRKTGEVGLKMSGQKDIYSLLYSGVYLNAIDEGGTLLNKVVRGEMSRAEAYRKLKIDKLEEPAIIRLDELMRQENVREATSFLARTRATDMVGQFSGGNNPGGMKRNIGRLMGQFGNWPSWYVGQLGQALGRGSYFERAATAMRYAAAGAALAGAGELMGVNLTSWSPFNPLAYVGGPSMDAYATSAQALFGNGWMQEQAQDRMKRWLPYNPDTDTWQLQQLYIPGAFFFNDLADALDMAQRGDARAPLRAVGFRPTQ